MARTVKNVLLRKTVTTAGTQVQISSTPLFVSDFEVQPAVGNTGSYSYIGDSSVDNTYIARAKGTITNFTAGDGHPYNVPMFDLSKWWVDSDANNDVIIIQYRILTED